MTAVCNGYCDDCPYDFCAPLPTSHKPSKAASRLTWQQEALAEVDDIGDLFGIDQATVQKLLGTRRGV